jgi:hypothetical protein
MTVVLGSSRREDGDAKTQEHFELYDGLAPDEETMFAEPHQS